MDEQQEHDEAVGPTDDAVGPTDDVVGTTDDGGFAALGLRHRHALGACA